MTPGRKLIPKVLLEGTRLTWKTGIAFGLNEHPRVVGPRRYRYHSPIVSAEWCALTDFPWGRGLINFEPHEKERAMEAYRTWVRLLFQQARYGGSPDFGWLEERPLPLGFRLVLCTRAPGSFEAARERRLKVSGNARQYDDLSLFVAEQERLRELARLSRLPLLELDVSDDDPARACDRIADWLDATGGLHDPG